MFFQSISWTPELVIPTRKSMACLSLLQNYTPCDSTIVVGAFRLAEVKHVLRDCESRSLSRTTSSSDSPVYVFEHLQALLLRTRHTLFSYSSRFPTSSCFSSSLNHPLSMHSAEPWLLTFGTPQSSLWTVARTDLSCPRLGPRTAAHSPHHLSLMRRSISLRVECRWSIARSAMSHIFKPKSSE